MPYTSLWSYSKFYDCFLSDDMVKHLNFAFRACLDFNFWGCQYILLWHVDAVMITLEKILGKYIVHSRDHSKMTNITSVQIDCSVTILRFELHFQIRKHNSVNQKKKLSFKECFDLFMLNLNYPDKCHHVLHQKPIFKVKMTNS